MNILNALKRLLRGLATGLLGVALMGLFLLLLTEWLMGCGESYVDAKGKTHTGECVFINGSGVTPASPKGADINKYHGTPKH